MDEEAENTARFKKWLIVGLAGLALAGLGGLAFFKTPAQPPASQGPAPAASSAATKQSGAAVGVRPDIIINRTKDVAGQVERNRQEEP
jgi:hypothetical protein